MERTTDIAIKCQFNKITKKYYTGIFKKFLGGNKDTWFIVHKSFVSK